MDFRNLYSLLTGPILWMVVIVFFSGWLIRLIHLFRISRQKDAVFYNHVSPKWAVASISYWLLPWGSVSLRSQPVFSFVIFFFHLSLISVPLLFAAHNILLEESVGISLFSMPDNLADGLTVCTILCGVFLFLRRVFRKEVRGLSEIKDYALLSLTILPFVTGFLSYHQIGHYQAMLIVHILSGEILLILIPFTKLSHSFFFFLSRAFIGFEMGGRRSAKPW